MVHRVSFRRLLFLASFVTVSIIVFQSWSPTYLLDPNVNYEKPEPNLLPSKNELSSTSIQILDKDEILTKYPFKDTDLKENIDNNNNINFEINNEYDSKVEPNDLKNGNSQEAPGSESEVGYALNLNSNPRSEPPILANSKTGEIEKTDESVTIETEDSSTLAEIQETLVETNKGLSNSEETDVKPNETKPNNQISNEKKTNGESKEKYWFFKNGTLRPTKPGNNDNRTLGGTNEKWKIWPHEAPNNDRIVDQLMYVPDTYDPSQVKTILLANQHYSWGVQSGTKVFQECPVNACTLSTNWKTNKSADAILFRDTISSSHDREPSQSKQIWIIYELESAVHSSISGFNRQQQEQINWTATYRVDSDIVTPYEKWVYYDENQKTDPKNRAINFAAGKTRQVAWFVSNCHDHNNRLQYAKELQKYISVDIYGACGSLECPRSAKCFELLDKDYKFYLSFENSNCKDYITEKFFVNGLSQNVIPIVMGASKSAYLRSAPLNSYIHVEDFSSPKELAQYLHQLDQNDTAYNDYFQWKGTGEFINTFFWCRLCTMVHDGGSAVVGKYTDVKRWWHEEACENKGNPWGK